MKYFILLLLFPCLIFSQEQNEIRTFHLKSGDILTGSVVNQDSSTGDIQIKTNFGIVTLKASNILPETVTIRLKNGDRMKGLLVAETTNEVVLKAEFGEISLNKNNIDRIDYGLQTTASVTVDNESKYTYGLERQVDVFYDPTGYCLDKNILYVSGLSWGFGLTNKIQITSRYYDYFFGDFNVRPKFQVFRTGNIAKEQALAVGFHFHNRGLPDKFEWHEGQYSAELVQSTWVNGNYTLVSKGTIPLYYGGYYRLGTEITNESYSDLKYNEDGYVESGDNFEVVSERDYCGEIFAAYTISKARRDNQGRIYHTFGGYVGLFKGSDDIYYRLYYAGAVDVRKKVIFNYEIFYDPYYIEIWNRNEFFDSGWVDLSPDKPEKPYSSPLHFDIGFIYTYNEWLHFGLHFQPYIIGVYLKF